MGTAIQYRCARIADLGVLRAMQALAVRHLAAEDYDPRQIESFLRHVGTMDDDLVLDETYFLAESGGQIVGSGGWSTRVPGCAKAARGAGAPGKRTPKLRSMYVHPAWARQCIASTLIETAESAARIAGFDCIELTATLTGRKAYRRRGYAEHAPTALRLPDGVLFPVVHMDKRLGPGAARRAEPAAWHADGPH